MMITGRISSVTPFVVHYFSNRVPLKKPVVLIESPHQTRGFVKCKVPGALGPITYRYVAPRSECELDDLLSVRAAEAIHFHPSDLKALTASSAEVTPSAAPVRAQACECGAAKVGFKPGQPGHSSWCPVK